jgi:hypothetical protein
MAINVETERNALDAALAAAKERIADLQAELERLRANTAIAICLWCEARVEKTAEAITTHLDVCTEHPMRALEPEGQRLRSLIGIVDGE